MPILINRIFSNEHRLRLGLLNTKHELNAMRVHQMSHSTQINTSVYCFYRLFFFPHQLREVLHSHRAHGEWATRGLSAKEAESFKKNSTTNKKKMADFY